MPKTKIVPGILFQEGESLKFENAGISHRWKIEVIFETLGWALIAMDKDHWRKFMIEDVNQRIQDGLMEVVK